MSDITIYKPAALVVEVVDGVPPVDQSAEIAALTAQVATLTSQNASLSAKIAAAQEALA